MIGQALASAERTVPDDRPVHSLHAYFLRGGSEDHEIDFKVERDLDGGSFSNRRVVASQLGKPILNLVASFHRRDEGRYHADPMPDVPGPETVPSNAERLQEAIARDDHPIYRWLAKLDRPIVMHELDPQDPTRPIVQTGPRHVWLRSAGRLPDDPDVHRCVLTYLSDMTLLGASLAQHALTWFDRTLHVASLDHAIWFHRSFRADEWLLYTTDSPSASGGRGLNLGRIYGQAGTLVASVAQESLMRERS